MGRRNAVLVGAALFLLTAKSRAQTNPSPAPPTAPKGSVRAPFVLGIEGGVAANRIETTHGFGAPNSFGDGPSVTDSVGSLNAGVIGLYAPFRAWSLGPRLSAADFIRPTYTSDSGYTVEAGLLSILHFPPPERLDGVHPRLLLGAAWSWETLPAPRSFAIEHSVSPASGSCMLIGIGFERTLKSASHQWWLDLRYSSCSFDHEHSMLDTRTQERSTESLRAFRASALLTLGVGWFLGGCPSEQ
jgi:hypothetical protein